jgi:hypothetical protein
MRRKRCSFTTLKKQNTNFHSIHILTVAVCHFSLTARKSQRDTTLDTSISPRKVTQPRYLKRQPPNSRNGVKKHSNKLIELYSCTIKKELHLKIAPTMKHSTIPFSSLSKRMVKE